MLCRRQLLSGFAGFCFRRRPVRFPSQNVDRGERGPEPKHSASVHGTANSSASSGEFIQPDYQAWSSVGIGTTEKEVESLLGAPEVMGVLQTDSPYESAPWIYGHLDFNDPTVPGRREFMLLLRNGTVMFKFDPFDGEYSFSGIPTTPRLMLPEDKASLRNEPHYLDLRWHPPAGRYPMHFEVIVEAGYHYRGDESVVVFGRPIRFRPLKRQTVSVPYLAVICGASIGRWRVRAFNTLGTSEWSDFRTFNFLHAGEK